MTTETLQERVQRLYQAMLARQEVEFLEDELERAREEHKRTWGDRWRIIPYPSDDEREFNENAIAEYEIACHRKDQSLENLAWLEKRIAEARVQCRKHLLVPNLLEPVEETEA